MKTVAVIFGGKSTEHDVSIITAIASIIKPLELTKKYKVLPVYITKDGSWYSDDKFADVATYQSDEVENLLRKLPKLKLLFDDGLKLVKNGKKLGRSEVVDVDVVFTAMHGTHGEDGELMGLLEMANVPYVGCDMPSSVLAMDKVLSKAIVSAAKIETPKFVHFRKHHYEENSDKFIKKVNDHLQYPLFVKPAHLGSSIGITKVDKPEDLANAIEVALHFDDRALVEEAVNNLLEVTLPIMGNENPTPALLEQPLLDSKDFFDFEKKYLGNGKKGGKKMGGKQGAQGYSKIPADVSKDLYDKAVNLALDVYAVIGCSGIARIDMLIDSKESVVYFNEINPLPGSLYAHNWNKAGVSNVELVDKLVQLAEARWQEKQKLSTGFDTSFLKQF
ncbi:MAG TPA: D-alanine--D-alanine ligase [Candidatus Saccharibacteria bacterium]|nr:D-alanine--D-alanine ligase [Candidatus Saccharibacteria bacterium]